MKILIAILGLFLAFGCVEESENVSEDSAPATTSPVSTPTCQAENTACGTSSDCCSGLTCNNNVCESSFSTCACDRLLGESCGTGTTGGNSCGNCCAGINTCVNNVCTAPNNSCTADGGACSNDSECCGNNCDGGFCQQGSTTPNPGGTPGVGTTTGSSTNKCYDPGVPDPEISTEYYIIPMKGIGGPDGGVKFSTLIDVPSSFPQSNFTTDGRWHFRVLVGPAPGRESLPFDQNSICTQSVDYGKLSFKVRVRGVDEDPNALPSGRITEFNEIKKYECSQTMMVPINSIPFNDDNPLKQIVMEFYDFKWDVDCTLDPTGTEGCNVRPMKPIWGDGVKGYQGVADACWAMHLHLATDETRDIPR